ncbi:MAG: histidine phosphatase family protein [Bdellovibrionota bacterium]
MSKKSLYIFRHGETDWNKAKRFQGHSDIDLNALGREQAANLQSVLAQVHPQVILSSDLSRAHNTAKIAAIKLLAVQPKIEIITTPLLREAHLGDVEGLERDVIIERYGEEFIERWFDPKHVDFAFPNGETKMAHLERLIKTINDLLQSHSHLDRFAISTHGGSVHRFIHHCENPPQERIFVTNGSLHHIEIELSTKKWFYRGQIS